MEATVRKNYAENLQQQQIEVRQLVMDGLKQAKEGKTKDFNAVCDRLEKKYTEQDLEFAADYIAFELNNPSVAVGFRTSKIQTVQSVWLRIESPTGIF